MFGAEAFPRMTTGTDLVPYESANGDVEQVANV